VASAGVEPASPAFQAGAETASATGPLTNLVEPIGIEPISPACKAGALPYELRSREKLVERTGVGKPHDWGDRRDSNPHDWSHNPVPEPFGHGHTCWSTRADSNRLLSGTRRGHLRLCFECYESSVTAGVTEQILRPLFYGHAHRPPQAARGVHAGRDHAVQQFHAGLFRRFRVLGLVALLAGRDQVLPGVAAAARARKHVIERQFTPMEPPAAVLAVGLSRR
jgi:hypothetical protein